MTRRLTVAELDALARAGITVDDLEGHNDGRED
jgi:hypothetical protein